VGFAKFLLLLLVPTYHVVKIDICGTHYCHYVLFCSLAH